MKEQNYKDLISLALELLSVSNVSVVINKSSPQILAGGSPWRHSWEMQLNDFPRSSSLTIQKEKLLWTEFIQITSMLSQRSLGVPEEQAEQRVWLNVCAYRWADRWTVSTPTQKPAWQVPSSTSELWKGSSDKFIMLWTINWCFHPTKKLL